MGFGLQDEAEVNLLAMLKDKDTSEADKRGTLVEEILHRYHIVTVEETGEMLWYNNTGLYVSGAEQKIQAELQNLAGFELTNHMRSEVMATIRAMTFKPRAEFDKDPDILNLKNGLLSLKTGEFAEHLWAHLSLVQLPVYYDKTAACPNLMRFLTSALATEELKIVIRMLGSLLLRSSKYEKAFMLTGSGSNGKSTLLKVIKTFLGPENVSNVSLQELVSDRFAAVHLDGRLANIFPDLKSERLVDTGIFKALVSGDRIHVQKKHQNGYSMENYAKMIFSANTIPETSDDSHAFYRRWCIIQFNHVYEGAEKDENLLAKLTTDDELSGLLNVALVGLKRLKEERGFEDTDLEEIRKQYQVGASKVFAFIDECCVKEPELQIPKFSLHGAFVEYCKKQGSNFCDITEFGKKLKEMGIETARPRRGKNREYVYVGIALKPGLGGPGGHATFEAAGDKNIISGKANSGLDHRPPRPTS